MSKYLEENGLAYFWSKIKQYIQGNVLNKVWPVANGGTGATNTSNAKVYLKSMGASFANGYYGLTTPGEDANAYIRTTSNGIIPSASNQTSGSGSVGVATWPFANMYTKKINGKDPNSASSYVVTKSEKLSTDASARINANATFTKTVSFTPNANYKPVGVVAIHKSGGNSGYLSLNSFNMDGLGAGTQSTLKVVYRNVGSSAVKPSDVTIEIQVVCVLAQ